MHSKNQETVEGLTLPNVSMGSAVLLAEEGWHLVRVLSMALAEAGAQVNVIIKGDPGRAVRAFITPRARVRNYFMPRLLFRLLLPFLLCTLKITQRSGVCVFTSNRTRNMIAPLCSIMGIKLFRLKERGDISSIEDARGQTISVEDLTSYLGMS